MRSTIAEQLDIRRRHESRPAEAVLELRKIWRQRQPENLCKFGVWTMALKLNNTSFIDFAWRDTATSESGFIARAPTLNFEHIAVATALLAELAALRGTPRMPAEREQHAAVQHSSRGIGHLDQARHRAVPAQRAAAS